ncbi:peptidase M24, structural domain-containing protein [Boeremia exigua]|uniref:peptidase M24, structural domain-containing protein n=1 Tax=Boeremia exigua TaxID=749465 RepID=UPI001E8E4876|nr:peptidase M24, structural domain-containing protein [Boeremia exigua]KAH6644474.1 peptidase M24, structural domain-containing protein [Boeremia exigua]
MDAFDGMDLAARLSMEAKEYWVHLDAEGPLEKYPAKQHARRVQEKLGIDEGLIYLAGQPAKNNEDSDMPAPFRQRRYFYYLTGCNEPSCHMTYDIQHDTLSLFIPRIDPRRVIWNGRGSTLAEAVERYDIDEVYYVDELGDVIKDWSNYHGGHGSDIYLLHDGQLPRIPGLHAIIDSESLQPAMNAARMIKDEHEISLIRRANDISSEAHQKVLANIVKFKNEAQVEGLFMDVCISHQAKQQAYDPIAASGPNAGTLHYDANNENFDDRQLMCLDAGCEFELYASDITRTFPLTESWPSKESENIYKLVERMQESCIERLAPGVRYLDLHILAHQIAIDGLLKLGILHNGTREEIYAAGTSRAFFPHGLGHHVGLEVHDVGQAELMSVRKGKAVLTQAPSLFPQNFHTPVFDPSLCHAPTDAKSSQLEEGMVVTVEPGIYFSNYALRHFYLPSPIHSHFINQDLLRRYMPVGGVRIEDDILITSKGYENLTTAPKGDAMFDIIRGHSTVLKQTQQPVANAPLLFRAPGCPRQTSPSTLPSIRRAATMPDHIVSDQHNGIRRDHTLSSRRSMTTDERVRYWRQSCQRSSLQHPPANAKKPTTICGSHSSDVKHTFMGDDCSRTQPMPGLLNCADCAILVQTLSRLRQNLTLSKEKSTKQASQPQNTPADPICRDRLQHTADKRPHARSIEFGVAQDTAGMCADRPQSDIDAYKSSSTPQAQQISTDQSENNASYTECVQSARRCTRAEAQDDITILHEPLAHPEPEQYYRGHELYAPPRTEVGLRGQQTASHALDPYLHDNSGSWPQTSLPVRTRMSWQPGQRRTSNHTDDRDWMA